jgi:SAM-dependent methyltransferase
MTDPRETVRAPAFADAAVDDRTFDAYYYRYCCGGGCQRDRSWLAFFGGVADRIVGDVQPRRVLDAGCAFGFLVEALRERGVEAMGMDISAYAIGNVHPSIRSYCRQGSITENLDADYDLIVTIEVLEHMPQADAERAIANMCTHTADILFSSSPLDHRELTHVNVQPPEYWAEQFARHGFYRDVDFDASFITPWAVRFRKRDAPVHRIVREYERRFAALAIERNEIRKHALELQTELATYKRPLHRKVWWLARRIGGRVLRPFRR